MSKYIKNLITAELGKRLEGVEEALLVNVIGLDANKSVTLRKELRENEIQLLVVKNSLARRAAEGTPLAKALDQAEGTLAIMWGTDDAVTLAKAARRLQENPDYAAFKARGGLMEGEPITPQRVAEISKWPNREEQLSILVDQILAPGANLIGALLGPGGGLASQIKKKSEEEE